MVLPFSEYCTEAWKFIEFAKNVERSFRRGQNEYQGGSVNSKKAQDCDILTTSQQDLSDTHIRFPGFKHGKSNSIDHPGAVESLKKGEQASIKLMAPNCQTFTRQTTKIPSSYPDRAFTRDQPLSMFDKTIKDNSMSKVANNATSSHGKDSKQLPAGPNPDQNQEKFEHPGLNEEIHSKRLETWRDEDCSPLPSNSALPYDMEGSTQKALGGKRNFVSGKRKSNRDKVQENSLIESAQRSTALVKTLLSNPHGLTPGPATKYSSQPLPCPSTVDYPPPSYSAYAGYQKFDTTQQNSSQFDKGRAAKHIQNSGYSVVPQSSPYHYQFSADPSPASNYNLSRTHSINYLNTSVYPYDPRMTLQATTANDQRHVYPSNAVHQNQGHIPSKQGTMMPIPDVRNKTLSDLKQHRREKSYNNLQRESPKKSKTVQNGNRAQDRASASAKGIKKPKSLKRMDGIAKKYNLEP